MKIDFYLRFYTQPGQSIWLSGNWTILGEDDPGKIYPLEYVNGEFWHGSISLDEFPADPLNYHYILKGADDTLTDEGGNDRFIHAPDPGTEEIQVIDTWNYAGEFENVFYTSPFQEVLLPQHKPAKKNRAKTVPFTSTRFRPQRLCCSGPSTNAPQSNWRRWSWQTGPRAGRRPVPMHPIRR